MGQDNAKDYLELIKEATTILQKAYPGAVLFTAIGKPPSGVAKTADQLTKWSFRAQVGDNKTATLDYADGKFGTPQPSGMWLGLVFVPLPQGTIRLPEAIVILNKQGFTQGFTSVALGTPVVPDPQPMFWFCVDRQTQGVSASTGDFFPYLFPCSSGGSAGALQE